MRRDGVLKNNFKGKKGYFNDIQRNAGCGAVTPVEIPFLFLRGK